MGLSRQSFKIVRTDAYDDIVLLASEVALDDKSQPWSERKAGFANNEGLVDKESRHSDSSSD